MRKILSLMLAIMLCLSFSAVAFAETDATTDSEEKQEEVGTPIDAIWNTIQENTDEFNTQSAITIQYDEETGWIYIAGETTEMVKYWFENMTTLTKDHPEITGVPTLHIDYNFNNTTWHSEKSSKSGAETSLTLNTYNFTAKDKDTFVFPFCNLNQYTEDADVNNMFTDVITHTNGKYSIDFNQHTLYVKVRVTMQFITPTQSAVYENESEITSSYHKGSVDVVTKPSPPDIEDSFYGIQEQCVLFILKPAPTTHSLALANHDIKLEFQYSIDDEKQSDIITLPYQGDQRNYLVYLTQLKVDPNGEPLQISCRWADYTTDEYSDWTFVWPNMVTSLNSQPDLNLKDVPAFNASCALCNTCTMPGNLCMWVWIGIGIFGTIAITGFTVVIILKVRKNKTNKKEIHNA